MVFLCKICQNIPFGPGDRVQTRLIFTVFIVWWPWNSGQHHQNLNKSLNNPNFIIYEVWPVLFTWFKRQGADKLFFGQNLKNNYSFNSVVTLKIKSRSPKSNQIFKPSQCCNIWSLARICHLIQETGCSQAFFGQISKFQSAGVTLKMRSRSPKLITSFLPPNNAHVQVWSKSTDWFRR